MVNKFSITKALLYLILICLAGYTVFLNTYDRYTLIDFYDEDGVAEWAEVVCYFFASAIFFLLAKKQGFKNIWYLGYFLLCFFVAAEEFSWGQRVLGITTPTALESINLQHEINLHNIKGVQEHARMAGGLVILTICGLIPLSNKLIPRAKDYFNRFKIPVFPLWAAGIPAMAAMLMLAPRLLFGDKNFELDETGELYLSIAFLIFSLTEYFKNKSQAN